MHSNLRCGQSTTSSFCQASLPRCASMHLSSYGRLAFAVAGPTAWNSLSDDLRDQTLSTDSLRSLFETQLFSEY